MLHSILENPNFNIILLGIVGTIVVSCKDIFIKGFQLLFKKITAVFIFKVHIPDYEDLFEIVEQYLQDNFNKRQNVLFASLRPTLRPGGSISSFPEIKYKNAPNVFIIKHKGKRIFVEKLKIKIDHSTNLKSLLAFEYVIWGIRGKDVIHDFISSAKDYHYKDFPANRIQIRSIDSNGWFTSPNYITVKPLHRVILNQSVKKKIMDEITSFRHDKKWYYENSIAYKKIMWLYGPPGTGKTSLCLAIASYCKCDVYSMSLNSFKNDADFQRAFAELPAGCMVLFEDFEAFFDGRKSNCNVSFSSLLNVTDGCMYKEGVIICFTTNYIENVDPALLRPGRCDIKIEVPLPSCVEITEFLRCFYSDDTILLKGKFEITMSKVQEICIQNKNDKYGAILSLSSAQKSTNDFFDIDRFTLNKS